MNNLLAPTTDEIVGHFLSHAERVYKRRARPKFLTRLLGKRSSRPRLASIDVLRADDADAKLLLCRGAVVKAWRVNDVGVNEIELVQEPEVGKRYYKHRQQFHFYIAEKAGTLIINQMEGPEDGTFMEARFVQKKGGWRLKVLRARLLLKGALVG